jgi:hypothetical protein
VEAEECTYYSIFARLYGIQNGLYFEEGGLGEGVTVITTSLPIRRLSVGGSEWQNLGITSFFPYCRLSFPP